MRCDEAYALIEGRARLSFQPEEHPAFEAHLAACDTCRETYQGAVLAEQAAEAWQDEPVPHWDRHAALFPRRQGWSPLVWLPVAACMVMLLLTALRVEVTSDADGLRIAFGGAGQAAAQAAQQARMEALLQTALAADRAQTSEALQAMLKDYDARTQRAVETMAVRVSGTLRDDYRRDMKTLGREWKEARRDDHLWMESRLNEVMVRQERTHRNLTKMAAYVSREGAAP